MPKHDSSTVALNDEGSDLSALLNDQPAVHRDTPTATVLEAFRRQANLNSLAVLDEQGQPCGIVHRHSLSDALLKPFATDLFARKPISRLMNDDFLAVEMSQSLQQVSRLITSRARQRIEEDFIITLNGGYLGLGRVIDVLKLITELKIQQARYANPLTLLPGNVPIQQCLTRLLQQGRESIICYVDIDSFKPFNDLKGFHCLKFIDVPSPTSTQDREQGAIAERSTKLRITIDFPPTSYTDGDPSPEKN